jgi:pyrimidine-nucleoside phosphorylase
VNILQIIDKKRRGESHTQAELTWLVDQMMAGELHDYQMAAWLMAVCCMGLNLDETTWLTDLYVRSGTTLDFSQAGGVVVDKHSTGGVGDKTTLVLAPMLVACGVKVAKLSGRGLGFTGGTIDKLEAIPGFEVDLAADRFLAQVQQIGIALGAQTAELAPADGKIYALRDVTSTVASIPLIAASVVSKKIAAGARVITLDIKVGEGAFMKSLEEAKALAYTCREIGHRLGRAISTVISSMEQPLGNAIGHTVEVIEAVDTLRGEGPQDLTELCTILGGMTLVDAQIVPSLEAGKARMHEVIQNGAALAKFRELIAAQQGNPGIIDDYTLMPHPKHKVSVVAPSSGIIQSCDALKVAEAAKVLGAGRLTKSAPIDLSVGVILCRKIGDPVIQGEPLAELWVNDKGQADATRLILEAYQILEKPVTPPSLVEELFLATAAVSNPVA